MPIFRCLCPKLHSTSPSQYSTKSFPHQQDRTHVLKERPKKKCYRDNCSRIQPCQVLHQTLPITELLLLLHREGGSNSSLRAADRRKRRRRWRGGRDVGNANDRARKGVGREGRGDNVTTSGGGSAGCRRTADVEGRAGGCGEGRGCAEGTAAASAGRGADGAEAGLPGAGLLLLLAGAAGGSGRGAAGCAGTSGRVLKWNFSN